MADLVADVVTVEALAAQARGIHISTHIDADLDRAWLDPAKIKQVVHNLVSNAVRFSPDGGVVDIALRRRGDMIELSVRDHGPGVPEEFRDRLFQPFERSADQDTQGTGLGLAIVHQIVLHHGGSIEVEQAAGGGARFVVTLPRDGRDIDGEAAAS
ncbi:MAG: ATP-binding protein [Deltaproteobacteria bacterium]|nr:MAG: ATP-binding protein [Deltaproteobacteria bacterium]